MTILLILIPAVWLAVCVFCVLLGRAAALGDMALAAETLAERRQEQLAGVVVCAGSGALRARDLRDLRDGASVPEASASGPVSVGA